MSDIENPRVTSKGLSVLEILDLHPGWTVAEAIAHIESIEAAVERGGVR